MVFRQSIIVCCVLGFLMGPSCFSKNKESLTNVPPQQTGPSEKEMKEYLQEFGFYKDMKINEAVSEFNARAAKNEVGKSQPPLTSQELLTAIRSWNNELKPIDGTIFREFQNIAKTGIVPKGSYIGFIKGFFSTNGYDGEFWIIYMAVGLNRNYTMEREDRPHYSHYIRVQYLNSRPAKLHFKSD